MDLRLLIPILSIVGSFVVILTWMNHRHEREKARLGRGAEQNGLAEENARLRATVARLEQRMAVLEQIATDPAERTAREIERLR